MPLPTALLHFFEPPVSQDEAARLRRVIWPVYWVAVALSLVIVALQLLQPTGTRQALPALETLVAMALVYPVMRRGHERLGGALILLGSCAMNLYSMWIQGGVGAPASRAYTVLIVSAGLAVGAHLVLPVLLIGMGAFGLCLLGQAEGWIQGTLPWHQAQLHSATAVGLMLVTAVLVYFAAETMRQRALFNESIVAALPGVIYIYDRTAGRNQWLNRSLVGQLGWDPGRSWEAVFREAMHPEDLARVGRLLERWDSVQDGEILQSEFQLRDTQGRWHTFETHDTVYRRGERGQVTHFIGYIEEVTEKRRAEESLSRAERLNALGQLAGGVAHDFNNVLAPILGHAELIRRGGLNPAELQQAAESIRRSADRARELTRRMLSLSANSALELRPVDLTQVVADFLPLLRRSLRQDLDLDFTPFPDPLTVLADPGQLEQALLNLALNAQDAVPGHGRLRVATRLDGAEAVLDFEDNGPGMSAEVRSRAFEPFFTTKQPGQGTGLGLSSVHAIVRQHNGRIELESEPGQGCRFRLSFPLYGAADSPTPADLPWPGRVLLVDDEEDLRVVLRRLLEALGWEVLEAATGDSALALATADPGPLTLLITDIRLPGLRGTELARQLLASRPSLRLLFISGFAETVEIDGPLLAKPFSLDQLKERLDQLRPRT